MSPESVLDYSHLQSPQPQNQYLVVLHRLIAISRTFRRLLHNLEVYLAMGILDSHNILGCCSHLDCHFHG